MRVPILIAIVAFSSRAYACCQAGADTFADSAAIHGPSGAMPKAVDTLDIKLLAEIWSHPPLRLRMFTRAARVSHTWTD